MMKSPIIFYSFVILLFFIFTGCEREDVEEFLPDEPLAVEVTVSIESADQIVVNGEAMSQDEMREYFENLAREESVHVYIHTTPDVDEAVIDEVRETIHAVEGVEIRPDLPDMERY